MLGRFINGDTAAPSSDYTFGGKGHSWFNYTGDLSSPFVPSTYTLGNAGDENTSMCQAEDTLK